ncbi:hypothetical protein E3O44_15815 [Cryobacterium algoricola]|uniref:ATP-binding protein n=1 Tax=Cryobacterium algoricola TaxID=1259183 RepID=A0ABY2IBI1_9MICO|nr:hypothetical protein [Cryobacterium algoricola]TFB84298.1 hypothetical protein E3O44_15815 [Cryobacterium algoricola]
MLYLVGGPGAGKSHAAAYVVSDLEEQSPLKDGLAHRTYRYETPTRPLTVVNDATIGDRLHSRGALGRDIDTATRDQTHFFACVNRGILVDESAVFPLLGRESDGPQGAVIDWLLREDNLKAPECPSGWEVRTNETKTDYLRSGRLFSAGAHLADVLVVFVDVCSLFEESPSATVSQLSSVGPSVNGESYRIARFHRRRDSDPRKFPAGELVAGVVKALQVDSEERDPAFLNPFQANLDSLSSDAVLSGFLSVLRASEIVSSQRMTYREVWGALVRALVGDLPAQIAGADIENFLESSQPVQPRALARFAELRALAAFRYTQSIFGIGDGTDQKDEALQNPVLRLTRLVDPVRDALPGTNSPTSDGWATPLFDAFASEAGHGSPLDALMLSLSPEDPFRDCVGAFDRGLDEAFVAALACSELKQRSEVVIWYSGYLMRLYATANGIPAFRREIEIWTNAWALSPKIPGTLESQLLTLLKPARVHGATDGASLIPIFDSRTSPITGESRPILALRTSSIEMETSRDSESLFLRLKESGKEIRRVLLDFPLVREALACGEGYAGVTELSDITSPRLERFRAARLVPGKQMDTQRYRVVVGLTDEVLSVGEAF